MSNLTFLQAKNLLISILKSKGWEVSTDLKIPWARNRYLDKKYYFKPQSILMTYYDAHMQRARSTFNTHKEILKNKILLQQFIAGEL